MKLASTAGDTLNVAFPACWTNIYKSINYGYDDITQTTHVVKTTDTELKVFSYVDTPEFKKDVELARKWYQAGFYPKDAQPSGDAIAAFKAGKFAIQLHLVPPGN